MTVLESVRVSDAIFVNLISTVTQFEKVASDTQDPDASKIRPCWQEFLNTFEASTGEKWNKVWARSVKACLSLVTLLIRIQNWKGERIPHAHKHWKKVDAKRVASQFIQDEDEMKMFEKLLSLCPDNAPLNF